jgi:hypothetical protein
MDKKPKGYRVRFEKIVESKPVTEFLPDESAAPFDSDVTAWRGAWKLAQSVEYHAESPEDGAIVNILVVDDQKNPVKNYATNRFEVYHPFTSE